MIDNPLEIVANAFIPNFRSSIQPYGQFLSAMEKIVLPLDCERQNIPNGKKLWHAFYKKLGRDSEDRFLDVYEEKQKEINKIMAKQVKNRVLAFSRLIGSDFFPRDYKRIDDIVEFTL